MFLNEEWARTLVADRRNELQHLRRPVGPPIDRRWRRAIRSRRADRSS